jgi:uncharacterized protein
MQTMPTDTLYRRADPAPQEALLQPGTRKRKRSRRAVFLTWLRNIHLYVGLWGAVLGLLFGTTGLLMNHRGIMKIPVEQATKKTAQLPLPEGGFASPKEMAAWLQNELQLTPAEKPLVRSQPAKKVIWNDREVMQPERWSINLMQPGRGVSAEYFVGNRFVKLDQMDATPIGTLMRLHKSEGVNAFWVLLSDTIAGSLILLSLTGLLLWTQLHTVRTVAVLTSAGALLSAVWFMWSL